MAVTQRKLLTIDTKTQSFKLLHNVTAAEALKHTKEIITWTANGTPGNIPSATPGLAQKRSNSGFDLSRNANVSVIYEIYIHNDISANWAFDKFQTGRFATPKLQERTFSLDCRPGMITSFLADNSRKVMFECVKGTDEIVFDLHLINKTRQGILQVIIDPTIRNPNLI